MVILILSLTSNKNNTLYVSDLTRLESYRIESNVSFTILVNDGNFPGSHSRMDICV